MTEYRHNLAINRPMLAYVNPLAAGAVFVVPGSIFYLLFRRGTSDEEALHVSVMVLATSAHEISVKSESEHHDGKGDSS